MKRLLITLLTCTVALLTGCDKPAGTPASQPGDTKAKGTIGVSLLTLDNPFFKVIGDNITAEGKKRGYEAIVVSGTLISKPRTRNASCPRHWARGQAG